MAEVRVYIEALLFDGDDRHTTLRIPPGVGGRGGRWQPAQVAVCAGCGALVVDRVAHDQFHRAFASAQLGAAGVQA